MRNLFDPARPDAEAVRRVKTLVAEHFALSEATTLSVAELRCHEPDCPPVETVVTARQADGAVRDWRIAKAVKDILAADVARLT